MPMLHCVLVRNSARGGWQVSEGSGFSQATIDYLIDLEDNNNREWFQDNRSRYDECVLAPAFGFISAHGRTSSRHLQAPDGDSEA